MPRKAARRQEERSSGERLYQVIRYGGGEYSESEPMPESQARYVAQLAERQDRRMHASIVPARGER